MSQTDPGLAPRLAQAPTYQAALAGRWKQPINNTPAAKAILLREAARVDGIDIPSGYAFDEKRGFYDANADHWYSDPRVLGPIAVGAAGGIGAIATAPAAGGAAGTASAAPAFGASAAPAAAEGALASTSVPVMSASAAPAAIASQGASSAAATAAAGAGGSATAKLAQALRNPKNLAALAAVGLDGVASLTAGADHAVSDEQIKAEIAKALQLQRGRVEQAQPAYDTLVRMSYGMSPTAYRGPAPAGYQAPEQNNPAYAYQAPRFGGSR